MSATKAIFTARLIRQRSACEIYRSAYFDYIPWLITRSATCINRIRATQIEVSHKPRGNSAQLSSQVNIHYLFSVSGGTSE